MGLSQNKWGVCLLMGWILILWGCELPPEPSKPVEIPEVMVRLVEVEYREIPPPRMGLLADKVNLLTFEIESPISAKAVEFCGRAVMTGPPHSQIHLIHFRTDTASGYPPIPDTVYNVVESILPHRRFLILRPKIPTNEFYPFSGNQGRIAALTLTGVWLIDEEGGRVPTRLKEGD